MVFELFMITKMRCSKGSLSGKSRDYVSSRREAGIFGYAGIVNSLTT